MTTTQITETLTALADECSKALPTTHTAAGEPLAVVRRIVNNHRVTVRTAGWDSRVTFWIDFSDEDLDLGQAAAQVAG